jgi:hypothetical protein
MQLTNSRPIKRQIPPDEQRPPIALLVGTFFISFFVLSIFLSDKPKPCNELVTLQNLERKIDSEITDKRRADNLL